MGDKSHIEWTDATWNPLAGCTPVSEGCRNCYAATLAYRLAAMGQEKYKGTVKIVSDGRKVFNGHINLAEDTLDQPLRWKRPRRIFVNSMSDLFHEQVPAEFILRVFMVMRQASQHTFQVLTKRPERMRWFMAEYLPSAEALADGSLQRLPPAPNIWLGTSVENQAAADTRIPELLKTPAAVRFLSCEPLLGPVDLGRWLRTHWAMNQHWVTYPPGFPVEVPGISWVIVGGESGPGARPMRPDWARGLRDACVEAGVAFYLKQWGEYLPITWRQAFEDKNPKPSITLNSDGSSVYTQVAHLIGARDTGDVCMERVGKHKAGRVLDGRTWDEFPQ